jgi:hypothetical protein
MNERKRIIKEIEQIAEIDPEGSYDEEDREIVIPWLKWKAFKEKKGDFKKGITDKLINLAENGFFDKPKTIGQIAMSINDKTTAISPIMLRLMKKGIFKRMGLRKYYMYTVDCIPKREKGDS